MTEAICSSKRLSAAAVRIGLAASAMSVLMITHAAGKPAPVKKPAPKKPAVSKRVASPASAKLAPSVVTPGSLKSFAQEIPGSKVKFEMVAVPGGTMTMRDPANPSKTVTVQIKPFWIEKTETRWEEYNLYALQRNKKDATPGSADAVSKPSTTYIPPDRGFGTTGYPAISIAYNGAKTYCEWLSAMTGKKYRLPTEAEWEWACRAGSNNIAPLTGAQLTKVAWFKGNSPDSTFPKGRTHLSGKKAANAWGLFDMIGNAAEWCQPIGESAPAVRGGSFLSPAGTLSCATRDPYTLKWQEEDPQFPKSKWWLSNGEFAGLRVVCEP